MATITFHPELFSLSPEHRTVLRAELEHCLAHHPTAPGERIPLHQGRYVAHLLQDGDGPPCWQIRRPDAEAISRANLTTAIETWLDLHPSVQDLAMVVEVITSVLARQQRGKQEGRP